MSEKVWKKDSSLKLVRTWLPSRRITRRSESNPETEERKKRRHEPSNLILNDK